MMNELISYNDSLMLRELGFDEACFAWYKNGKLRIELYWNLSELGNQDCVAPTFSQAFRFFRERHGLYGLYTMGDYENNFYWQIWRNDSITKTYITASNYVFEKYEEAELACLLKLIEIVKNK